MRVERRGDICSYWHMPSTCVARVIWKISIVRVTMSWTVSCPIRQRNTGEISLRAPWGGIGCWPGAEGAVGGRWVCC